MNIDNYDYKWNVLDKLLFEVDNAKVGETFADIEVKFDEAEWRELNVWLISLLILVENYGQDINKMVKRTKEKAIANPKFIEDYHMALHLKKMLDGNPLKLLQFIELVDSFVKSFEDAMRRGEYSCHV